MAAPKTTTRPKHTASDKPKGQTHYDAPPDNGQPLLGMGMTTKNSRYLQDITDKVAGDKKHPIHHGIKMQAHHIVSATAMAMIPEVAEQLREYGYNINHLPNLVFLPCTLEGACHLGVQPHRGNHTTKVMGKNVSIDPDSQAGNPEHYNDDAEGRNYHEMVKLRIAKLQLGFTKECPGYKGGAARLAAREHAVSEMNSLSKSILKLIQRNPTEAPLTNIAAYFQPGDHIGCGGVTKVALHPGYTKTNSSLALQAQAARLRAASTSTTHRCPVGRNHATPISGQGEKITYVLDAPYKLTPGQ